MIPHAWRPLNPYRFINIHIHSKRLQDASVKVKFTASKLGMKNKLKRKPKKQRELHYSSTCISIWYNTIKLQEGLSTKSLVLNVFGKRVIMKTLTGLLSWNPLPQTASEFDFLSRFGIIFSLRNCDFFLKGRIFIFWPALVQRDYFLHWI